MLCFIIDTEIESVETRLASSMHVIYSALYPATHPHEPKNIFMAMANGFPFFLI